MAEPASSFVLNSLLATRLSAVRSPTAHNSLKLLSSNATNTFPPNFFTPNPRESKGKVRAVQPDLSHSPINSSHPWHPDIFENVLLDKWCFIPETPSSRSQSPSLTSPIVPSSPRRYTTPRHVLLKCADPDQRRHVSSVPVYDERIKLKLTPNEEQKEAKKALLSCLPRRKDMFEDLHADVKKAWDAYVRVQECGAGVFIHSSALRVLADLIANDAERHYFNVDISLVYERGKQLKNVLYSLNGRKNKHRHMLHLLALTCRANCMQGQFSKARLWFSLLPKTALESRYNNLVVDCLKEMTLSLNHFHGIQPTIEWMSTRMSLMFPFVTLRQLPLGVNPNKLSVLRKIVLDLVDNFESPAAFLKSREHTWALVRKKKLGDLLIQSLCQLDLPRDALTVLEELRRQSIFPFFPLQLLVVKSLVHDESFESANILYSKISHELRIPEKTKDFLLTGLLLFSQQGNVDRAREIFKTIEGQDMVSKISIAMMLHATAVNGQVKETIEFFDRWFPPGSSMDTFMIEPNVVHFTEVILAHSRSRDLEGMTRWLDKMGTYKISADEKLFTQVLKTFADRGDTDAIAVVLDQMRQSGFRPTMFDYTSIIALLARRRDPVVAESVYRHAIENGIVPDVQMVQALMNAHVEAGSWKGVIRVFDYMATSTNRRLRPNIHVYNVLLKAYVLIGAPYRIVADIVLKLQDAALRPNEYTFALLIQSACDSGRMDSAAELYNRMVALASNWQTNLRISAYVLTIIMAGHLRFGHKREARRVFDEMKERGIAPTAVTMSVILSAYANEGTEASWKVAEQFLESFKLEKHTMEFDPSSGRESALQILYSPLMNVYKLNKRVEDVERLYAEALDIEGEPTLGFLTVLLDTYRRTGNIEGVHQIWPQVFELGLKYSQTHLPLASVVSQNSLPMTSYPSSILCIPLSIYIDALSAAGEHNEIANIWKKFKANNLAFDSHNWNHLTVAMVRAGEPERAFEVVERIILPYQQTVSSTFRSRDKNPETPLSFDGEPPTADDPLPEPKAASGLSWNPRRVQQVKIARSNMRHWLNREAAGADEEDSASDFAHSLHVLHQISPSWGTWRPHVATLSVLSEVIRHLASGQLVEPWDPERLSETSRRTESVEDIERRRETANATLQRIYKNYPEAVRVVEVYGMQEQE